MIRAAVLLLIASASFAGAQGAGRPCRITWGQLPDSSHAEWTYLPNGTIQMFVGGGFRAWCQGTNRVVTSDSAEYYESQQLVHLIGRARYTEDGATLSADRIRYNAGTEYLEATGNVRLQSGGSTLTSAHLIYFRASPGIRAGTEAYATGRPRVVVRDTATGPGADTSTTIIDADRLRMQGDTMFFGGGNVVITRTDIIATADSVETDRASETARLVTGSPRVEGTGENAFSLTGRIIDVFGRARQISRVYARGDAEAVSDSLRLVADTIDIRMSVSRIDSIAAWGGERSHAYAPGQDIVARSISISMPGQRLRSLLAAGQARVETLADSGIRSSERDWLAGDTVSATFTDLASGADTTTAVALSSLIAWGNAQSFYQLASEGRTDSLPSLSYVVGRRIQVEFADGGISNVRVLDEVRGILLEPVRADTAGVVRRNQPPGRRP